MKSFTNIKLLEGLIKFYIALVLWAFITLLIVQVRSSSDKTSIEPQTDEDKALKEMIQH